MLPQDPFILLSYVNTKLRDFCSSFPDFCADNELDGAEIEAKLAAIGCAYDPAHNRFE
ncbi:DUF4250 domain-containing protein [Pseudoflavonifractor phocaeensis]|uniref:DUF4250 domain-containing protein n=1 Tax=Pseudoflavonifractor phocaeensis TaxID=1870988 RepID=UPI00210CF36B|nr:DUF4250 domain-containing protein [Pseudoflavonifractor phocaeensis]MCQ4864810.1 DUF4250 domain-containing protein [Pseudoflavonifractor phocaeensis]